MLGVTASFYGRRESSMNLIVVVMNKYLLVKGYDRNSFVGEFYSLLHT